jgi:hypothetical protein
MDDIKSKLILKLFFAGPPTNPETPFQLILDLLQYLVIQKHLLKLAKPQQNSLLIAHLLIL